MVNIFRSVLFNSVCLRCILATFSLNTLPMYAAPQVTVNDAVFALKIEKIVEKIKNMPNKKIDQNFLRQCSILSKRLKIILVIKLIWIVYLAISKRTFLKMAVAKKTLR